MPDAPRPYLTPPELARLWRCAPETIIAHIRAERLRAFTTSPPGSRRPRWRIPVEAVAEFEQRQSPRPAPKPGPRRRNDPDVIEFF